MKNSDGRDLVFAVAGILWGTVTVFRGFQQWRQENERQRQSAYSTGALPLTKMEFPFVMMMGAALAIGGVAYMVWSLVAL